LLKYLGKTVTVVCVNVGEMKGGHMCVHLQEACERDSLKVAVERNIEACERDSL